MPTNADPFEHFNVLIKKSYRMKSRLVLISMHKTMKNMSRALDSMKRIESQEHETVVAVSVPRERKFVESSGGCLVGNGVCLSLRRVSERVKRAKAAV